MKLQEMAKELDEYVSITDKDGNLDLGYLELRLITLSSKEEAQRLAKRVFDRLHPADLKKAEKLAKSLGSHYANMFFLDALRKHQMTSLETVRAK